MEKSLLSRVFCLLLPVILIGACKSTSTSNQVPTSKPETKKLLSPLPAGTYKLTICNGFCNTDPQAINGVLVLDSSRSIFSKQSDAMRSFMGSRSGVALPNYCYFFDPETSNSKGSLFEYDIVGFGETSSYEGKVRLWFMLSSPDFRYVSDVQSVEAGSFIGNWHSTYAGDGGSNQNFARVQLRAERISEPKAEVCFDAVRKFNQIELQSFCTEFPKKSCESGFRP